MIQEGDRALAVGHTGEGKSEALLHLFARYPGQRLLLDGSDHYSLGPDAIAQGAVEADDPHDLDWRARTIRYVWRRPGDLKEVAAVYRAAFARAQERPLLVLADELEDVAPVGRTPVEVRRAVKQGRKHGLTHLGGTQYPWGIDTSLITQATQVYVFRMFTTQETAPIAPRLGMQARELVDVLRAMPQHGYLLHRLGSDPLRFPPLPPDVLAYTRRHVVNP